MADLTLYFGTPGSLVSIALPRNGLAAPRNRGSQTYQLASGGTRAGRMASGKRSYTIDYQALNYVDFATLLAFDQGHNGTGPFAILDPGQRNLLTANQSAATSVTNDTSNFTPAGSGVSLASESATVHRGPRSLRMTMVIAAPTATLTLDPPAPDWPGIPCPIRAHTFSLVMLGGGADAIVTAQAKMTYLSAVGAVLGSTTGTSATSNAATWTSLSVTGTPTAGSAFLNCSVAISGASVSAGAVLYLSDLMLNEGSAADALWSPGTGVLPVVVMSLGDHQPGYYTNFRDAAGLTLQEVGP
jgi:hypothetical protein